MRHYWSRSIFACAALAAFAPGAQALCTFGPSGEPTLQQSFDGLFGASNAPNAETDCLADGSAAGQDGIWRSSAASATVLLEIAGFANQNTFGLYDPTTPSNLFEVFAGPMGPGTTASLTFTSVSGGTQVSVTIEGSIEPPRVTTFSSEAFGFYITTPEGNTFFSQSQLNSDGADHSYAYRGEGQVFTGGPLAGTTFGARDAILAYEDLVHSDDDFQDFVVLVRGVEPIPLPAAAWLLISGFAGLGAMRRRLAL